jgi:hypothetical protein
MRSNSRINPPEMTDVDREEMGDPDGSVYRVAGALTITRAATTQRESITPARPIALPVRSPSRARRPRSAKLTRCRIR